MATYILCKCITRFTIKMADLPLKVDGDDNFGLGMDSYVQPTKLLPGQYADSMNTICRGGIVQTRPGSVPMSYTDTPTQSYLPTGNIQGMCLFTPTGGVVHQVFCISGIVYVSAFPFKSYRRLSSYLAGPDFSPYQRFVAWAQCVQTTEFNDDGVLVFLDQPRNILVMQDGASRARYWDGSTFRQLNPTPDTTETTKPMMAETPMGLWMRWSNNRLWVSRGNQIFASDIGNPLKFTEQKYLNEGRAFYLPGDCTGIAETADRQGIICFTDTSGTYLQSSIQDRALWLTTPNFQQNVLNGIGCVSARSIVQQYGLLWWMTPKGVISQDDATRLHISSRLSIADDEMIQSKANLSYDLSGVAGGYTENFLFHAVPYGDKRNTRIHVLDQAPNEDQLTAWPSYWTGWIPVEFACGVVNGQERVFCISYGWDNFNRIWELFRPEKTDAGMPITSFVVTRQLLFGDRDYKKFRFAEIEMCNLHGPTAVMAAVAGIKGAFQTIMTKDIVADYGQIYTGYEYGWETHKFAGTRDQTRIVRTIDQSEPSACNDACIESPHRGLIDKAFQLLFVWSGIAGINTYRMFCQYESVPNKGECEVNETGNKLLTIDGCGKDTLFSTSSSFDSFTSVEQYDLNGLPWFGQAESVINQEDADRKALTQAQFRAFEFNGMN